MMSVAVEHAMRRQSGRKAEAVVRYLNHRGPWVGHAAVDGRIQTSVFVAIAAVAPLES